MFWDRINRTKQKMERGEPSLGFFVCTPEPTLIEIMGMTGFDYAAFDMEHGRLGIRDIENLVRVCDAVGLTPLVRIPYGDFNIALRCLESGAQGIVMSHTCRGEDVRRLVQCCRYAPQGRRGFAVNTRTSDYGINDPKAYIRSANQNILVAAMVEDVEGVDNLDAILGENGLDLVFIGPGDLSNDMGHVCEFSHPEVLKTMDNIVQRTLRAGKQMAMFASEWEVARRYMQAGVRMIAYMSEVDLFARACKETVSNFRIISAEV